MNKRRKANPDQLAVNELLKEGFLVLHLPNIEVSTERWDRVVSLMPEFKTNASAYVGGGGHLANASSFHNSLVRRLRIAVFESAREIFTTLADQLGFDRMELIMDQMLQRMPGQRSLEEWNLDRPKSRNLEQGDVILLGWFNVDDTAQVFTCCPGSHNLALHSDQWRTKAQKILVPPKYMVVFLHNLVTFSATTVARQRRLNMAWRLTNSTLPFVPDIEQRLEKQDIVPLWNGELPSMWPANYWTNYRNKLYQLSENFVPIMRVDEGSITGVIFRWCPSLTTLGLALYSKYTTEEQSYYKPFLL